MPGFPQRNLLVGNANWVGDAEQDAQTSQDNFDSLALLLNQLKNRLIAGLARILSPQVFGVTDGSNAPSGGIGEYVTASIAAGGVTGWVSGTGQNVVSLNLTAGDWDVEGVVRWDGNGGAITGNGSAISISTTSTIIAGTEDRAESPTMPTAAWSVQYVTPVSRVSLTNTQNVYLVGVINFSAGTPRAGGRIRARRVR